MRRLIPLALALAFAAPALGDHHASKSTAAASSIDAVLAHSRRDGDRARDEWRHPAETLAFFEVQPGMTVVDYMPSSGWYTRILVPMLGKEGRYIGLNPHVPDSASEGLKKYLCGLNEKFLPESAKWNLEGASVEAFNTEELGADRNGTVDRILIFREMHNLYRNNFTHGEFTRFHALLKPGGMIGVVQHRARPDAPAAYTDGNRGYMRQKDVIGLIEAHGFDLVATSEINANPRDPADWPAGVWELAPNLRTKREELRAIGESDRMTLLFRRRD